jgi:hypothetical protein
MSKRFESDRVKVEIVKGGYIVIKDKKYYPYLEISMLDDLIIQLQRIQLDLEMEKLKEADCKKEGWQYDNVSKLFSPESDRSAVDAFDYWINPREHFPLEPLGHTIRMEQHLNLAAKNNSLNTKN